MQAFHRDLLIAIECLLFIIILLKIFKIWIKVYSSHKILEKLFYIQITYRFYLTIGFNVFLILRLMKVPVSVNIVRAKLNLDMQSSKLGQLCVK